MWDILTRCPHFSIRQTLLNLDAPGRDSRFWYFSLLKKALLLPCFPLQRKVNTLGLHLQYNPSFFYLCFYLHPSDLSFIICLVKSVFHCFSQQLQFLLYLILIITDFYYIQFLLHPIFIATDLLPRRGCFSLTPRWLKGREASRQPSWGKIRVIQLGRRPCRSPLVCSREILTTIP